MAKFVCAECGAERECRCKPKECEQCGTTGRFEKVEETVSK